MTRDRRVVSHQARRIAYANSEWGRKYPDSIPWVSETGKWLYQMVTIGSLYSNETRYPGAFPRTLLPRLMALFPEVRPNRILHVFSGSVPPGRWTRLDINPTLKPEIVGSIYDLPALLRGWPRFDLVIADPAYSREDAKQLYGTHWVDSARCFRAMAEALEPGTHVAWLSTHLPMYQKRSWHRWGRTAPERSGGHRYREIAYFTRRPR